MAKKQSKNVQDGHHAGDKRAVWVAVLAVLLLMVTCTTGYVCQRGRVHVHSTYSDSNLSIEEAATIATLSFARFIRLSSRAKRSSSFSDR